MNEETKESTKGIWEHFAAQCQNRDFHLGASAVMSRFTKLEQYITLVEAQMEEVQRIEQMGLGKSGDPEEDEYEWRNHYYDFDEHYVPTLRYSLIVMIHMIVERSLVECCEWVKHQKNCPISHRDLKGSLLEQSRTYLQKIAGAKMGELRDWERINSAQDIRNCLVHELGETDDLPANKKKRIEEICRNELDLRIGQYGRLEIDISYVRRQVQYAKSFFAQLYEQLGFQWQ